MTDADASRSYLDRAVRRMRLGVRVRWDPAFPWCPHERWSIRLGVSEVNYGWSVSDATASYLRTVAELDPEAV